VSIFCVLLVVKFKKNVKVNTALTKVTHYTHYWTLVGNASTKRAIYLFPRFFFVFGNGIQGNSEKLYLPCLQKSTNRTCTKIDTSTKDDDI
jgi:hypothetical protein